MPAMYMYRPIDINYIYPRDTESAWFTLDIYKERRPWPGVKLIIYARLRNISFILNGGSYTVLNKLQHIVAHKHL